MGNGPYLLLVYQRLCQKAKLWQVIYHYIWIIYIYTYFYAIYIPFYDILWSLLCHDYPIPSITGGCTGTQACGAKLKVLSPHTYEAERVRGMSLGVRDSSCVHQMSFFPSDCLIYPLVI